MITYVDISLLSFALLIGLYIFGRKKYSYYKDKGVKYVEPPLPFFGSYLNLLLQKEHFIDFIDRNYNIHPEEKYIGLFEMQKPLLFIRDLELIKNITGKNFDNFSNHRNVLQEDLDVLYGNNLFSMEGNKWRIMRDTLSPAFTSSNLKNMFEFIEECAKDVGDYFVDQTMKTGKDVIGIEIKDEISKFANDVIATTAYGIKVNSFKNKENEFYKFGKGATSFEGIQLFKFFLFASIPKIMKRLKVSFIKPEVTTFFRDAVLNEMKYRSVNNILRSDMINLLMEAKKESLKNVEESTENLDVKNESVVSMQRKIKWTDDELVAQPFIFFLEGFETVSTFLTFFFYEMVCNPDIQKNLQKEIDQYNTNSDGKFIYGDLEKLKYLDMCISETLRIWPPALVVDRVCTKAYTFPPPSSSSEKTYIMNAGDALWIPIYAFHHDPKYFPNPKRFDPERFSDANKSSLNTLAYMPFGIGPRNCIGSRFAIMEAKVVIFHLLSRFDFISTEKTVIPVILDKSTFNLLAKGGMHLGMKLRNMKKNE